jgi:hypothetical protein
MATARRASVLGGGGAALAAASSPAALFLQFAAAWRPATAAPMAARSMHTSAPRCISAHHQDHYKVLGVTNRGASKADIKKQYYKVRPCTAHTVSAMRLERRDSNAQ